MANRYGEGFQQPLDYETGQPIPGSPHIAITGGGRGVVQLRPMENTNLDGSPAAPLPVTQPRVLDDLDGDNDYGCSCGGR